MVPELFAFGYPTFLVYLTMKGKIRIEDMFLFLFLAGTYLVVYFLVVWRIY
jgi:hypothetical protein